MANIQSFLNQIRGARYGKDVRSSIVNAIDAVNTESNNSVTKVNAAESRVNTAVSNANTATTLANAAATSANTAAANANEAAQAVLDEKYILTATTEMVRSGTARPTAKGNAILEKLTGSSWQRKLTGKNLWKNYDDPPTTVDGVTYIFNSDGSITAKGTATGDSIIEINDWDIGVNEIILTGCPNGGSDSTYYLYDVENDVKDTGNGVKYTSKKDNVVLNIVVKSGVTIDATFYPMVRLSTITDATYEPYCGATPSPNPEFQQTIRSTGDMGWFDGEWFSGYHTNGTGTEYTTTNWVGFKNKIPCEKGNLVKVIYDGEYVSNMVSFFYDGSYKNTIINALEFEIPSGANEFVVDFNGEGLSSSTVGHVCVTINGKYAVIVDEVRKNLVDASGLETTSTTSGVTATRVYDQNGRLQYIELNGTSSDNIWFAVSSNDFYLPQGAYYLSGNSGADGVQLICYMFNKSNSEMKSAWDYGTGKLFSLNEDIKFVRVQIRVSKGYTLSSVKLYPLLRRCDSNGNPIGDDTYAPYVHKRTYIPISEPLRAIGDVKDELVPVDEWYKVLRRVRRVEDKKWIFTVFGSDGANYKNVIVMVTDNALDRLDTGKACNNASCSHFRERTDSWISVGDIGEHKGTFAFHSNTTYYNYLYLGIAWETLGLTAGSGATKDDIVTAFDAWRTENPFYIDYLCEPYYEDLDQTPFYNLQSFDEVTHVSIAGLHEELEPTLTMRFPRHEDGALVTTAYCNSKKEAIERKAEMEEIKAAVLALSQS